MDTHAFYFVRTILSIDNTVMPPVGSVTSLASNICVVGLGYVGLPLALAFASEFPTIGFDIDSKRVDELAVGIDRNNEVDESEIKASGVDFTAERGRISDAEFIVVTVPTPVSGDNQPDLSFLESVSRIIGSQLKTRSGGLDAPIIVFESTTFPGCTQDFCGPLIESESGLRSGEGFFLGYSPERTAVGDNDHGMASVVKVVSGQTPAIADLVANTYRRIAKAGTYVASDIRTAEAAKLVENVQRDVNIALFNELAMLFDQMDIKSSEVFDAAATKWNFHRYSPGLVGGHCIPVDPYYLAYAASQMGSSADIVLASREKSESLVDFLADKLDGFTEMGREDRPDPNVLMLGLTFKADVNDLRNSKLIDLARTLNGRGYSVDVHDPNLNGYQDKTGSFRMIANPLETDQKWDALVIGVDHTQFQPEWMDMVRSKLNIPSVVIDISGKFKNQLGAIDGVKYWRL